MWQQKWNSASRKTLRLALSADELSYLDDACDQVNPARDPLPAEFNIQFLWKDTSSDWCFGSIFFQCIKLRSPLCDCSYQGNHAHFPCFDFLVIGLVCDGASTNLAAIKLMCHKERGTLRRKDEKKRLMKFSPGSRTISCQSCRHTAAFVLHTNSRTWSMPFTSLGTLWVVLNKLEQQKHYFGCRAIQDMYTREGTNQDHDELRIVPGLLKSHFDRDQNGCVHSKIMQVNLSH